MQRCVMFVRSHVFVMPSFVSELSWLIQYTLEYKRGKNSLNWKVLKLNQRNIDSYFVVSELSEFSNRGS